MQGNKIFQSCATVFETVSAINIPSRPITTVPIYIVYVNFSTFLETKTKLIVTSQKAINFECMS